MCGSRWTGDTGSAIRERFPTSNSFFWPFVVGSACLPVGRGMVPPEAESDDDKE